MAIVRARIIEPILLQRTNTLPEGAQWLYELKLDGYFSNEYLFLARQFVPPSTQSLARLVKISALIRHARPVRC